MYTSFSTRKQSSSPGGALPPTGQSPDPPDMATAVSRTTAAATASSSRPAGPKHQQKRPKRHQVSRACDTCRLHRIKCDNNEKCAPCVSRGVKCTNSGSKPAYTLSSAIARIDGLKTENRLLQEEVSYWKGVANNNTNIKRDRSEDQSPLNPPPLGPEFQPFTSDSLSFRGADIESDDDELWEGVSTVDPATHRTEYFGSSSPFHFMTKISSFLCSNTNPPPLSAVVPPIPKNPSMKLSPQSDSPGHVSFMADEYSRKVQDYYLSLYWENYHIMLPIIHQTEFQDHYESLWPDPKAYPHAPRRPSPLVDVLLALSAQFATNSTRRAGPHARNASVEGAAYFRRCQASMVGAMEHPSLTALQVYCLSAIYLLNASYANMAYHVLGLAVRLAHSLGFHREPSDKLPVHRKELQKRIWWTVYCLDIKLSTELGRPVGVQELLITCSLPDPTNEVARVSGSPGFQPFYGDPQSEINYLTFHLYGTKLHTSARDVYNYVYSTKRKPRVQDGVPLLESFAAALSTKLDLLERWKANLPKGLQFSRRDGGTSLSTDCSPVEFDHHAPMWLQRQRLSVEMHYHNFGVILHRPFINFAPIDGANRTPIADRHAFRCLQHARANAVLIHQILTEIDMLPGWYEAYYLCWNAALSIVGFIVAYPLSQYRRAARDAIDIALEVFELYAPTFPIASSALQITRTLLEKIDGIAERMRRGRGEHLVIPQFFAPLPPTTQSFHEDVPQHQHQVRNVIVPHEVMYPPQQQQQHAHPTPNQNQNRQFSPQEQQMLANQFLLQHPLHNPRPPIQPPPQPPTLMADHMDPELYVLWNGYGEELNTVLGGLDEINAGMAGGVGMGPVEIDWSIQDLEGGLFGGE